jgi:hypothetical protein
VSTRARATGIAGALIIAATTVSGVFASSHREAPLIATDPAADNTDLYAFVSPDDPSTVTIIANYVPLEEPAGGPNFNDFDPAVRYEIHIDNNGDAVDDLTYYFRFQTRAQSGQNGVSSFLYNNGQITSLSDPNLLVRQTCRSSRRTSALDRPRTTRRSRRPASGRWAAAGRSSRDRATTRSSSTSDRSSISVGCARSTDSTSCRSARPTAWMACRASTPTASPSRSRSRGSSAIRSTP